MISNHNCLRLQPRIRQLLQLGAEHINVARKAEKLFYFKAFRKNNSSIVAGTLEPNENKTLKKKTTNLMYRINFMHNAMKNCKSLSKSNLNSFFENAVAYKLALINYIATVSYIINTLLSKSA